MNTQRFLAPTLRSATAATLAVSGYIHAQLYIGGYRFVHIIGSLFLLQASAASALAVLLLMGTPPLLLRAAVAGVALGALGGFTASRTIGVFGFTEHGLQPAPQAVLSLVAEIGTLLLLAVWQVTVARQHRAARPPVTTPTWNQTTTSRPPTGCEAHDETGQGPGGGSLWDSGPAT